MEMGTKMQGSTNLMQGTRKNIFCVSAVLYNLVLNARKKIFRPLPPVADSIDGKLVPISSDTHKSVCMYIYIYI